MTWEYWVISKMNPSRAKNAIATRILAGVCRGPRGAVTEPVRSGRLGGRAAGGFGEADPVPPAVPACGQVQGDVAVAGGAGSDVDEVAAQGGAAHRAVERRGVKGRVSPCYQRLAAPGGAGGVDRFCGDGRGAAAEAALPPRSLVAAISGVLIVAASAFSPRTSRLLPWLHARSIRAG